MPYSKPFQVECFYSCDKKLALEVLNGSKELEPSENEWDWLGENYKRSWYKNA